MSHQIRRVLRIVSLLSSGQTLTTSEIAERLHNHEEKPVSQRQLQRDLRLISESGVPLHEEVEGRSIRWSIPSHARILKPFAIDANEILSLHILKGSLAAFRGTRIEADVDRLAKKLEKVVPGTVFMKDDLVAHVSPGHFTSAISDQALERIVYAIVDPHWDRVTYRSIDAAVAKTFVVSFCRLINHAGRLYVAAWHPKYNQYITLAADRIDHVERANDVTDPLHEFDEGVYRAARFGVYDGDLTTITLRIDADAVAFFSSRLWHPSQSFTHHRDGSATLKLHAPLSPELISWIVGWSDVLTIASPQRLKDICKAKVKRLMRS
jgi:predicted DNA-binding transcriptional regulator YafY